ncbi:MAG: outer membrane beta-barrel protein [Bacteroidia bacterium]
MKPSPHQTIMFIKKVNLKLSLFFAFLLITVLSGKVSAQNDFPIEPPTSDSTMNLKDSVFFWHGLYISPDMGGGLSKPFSGNGIENGFCFNAGAEVTYMFNNNFGISLGAQFEQYSFKYSYSDVYNAAALPVINTINRSAAYDSIGLGGYATDATYTFDFIRIPLLVRYISSPQNKVGLFAEAGIVADILMSTTVSGSASETEYDFHQDANVPYYNLNPGSVINTSDLGSSAPNAAKFNLALHTSLGTIIPVGNRTSLVLAYYYEFGLLNGGTGSNDVVNFSDGTYYFYGKNSNYGSLNKQALEIALIFKLSH